LVVDAVLKKFRDDEPGVGFSGPPREPADGDEFLRRESLTLAVFLMWVDSFFDSFWLLECSASKNFGKSKISDSIGHTGRTNAFSAVWNGVSRLLSENTCRKRLESSFSTGQKGVFLAWSNLLEAKYPVRIS